MKTPYEAQKIKRKELEDNLLEAYMFSEAIKTPDIVALDYDLSVQEIIASTLARGCLYAEKI